MAVGYWLLAISKKQLHKTKVKAKKPIAKS
jgi:hypothetical protein